MSAPSLAIPAAPAVGHAAPKRGAATPDADFAAILDESAPPEAPARTPAATGWKRDAEAAPAEDAFVEVAPETLADAAPVKNDLIVAASVPLIVAAVPVIVEAATMEAAPTAVAPAAEAPAPSDDLVLPPPMATGQPDAAVATAPMADDNAPAPVPAPAPAPAPTDQTRSGTETAPAVKAEAPSPAPASVPAPAPADMPDLAALQAEQTKGSAQNPSAAPVAKSAAAPVAATVAAPRPAKPAADVAVSAEAAPADAAEDAAALAAPLEAPAAPVDAPRTRDVIDRVQATRPEGRSGAFADPDVSPQADGPDAASPKASTPTASARLDPAVAAPPASLVLTGADEGVSAPLAAAAQPTEARPAQTVVSLALSTLSRATIETTAQIAAQIVRKLEGRSTRFEMALTPEGLGQVDVSLDIDADGKLIARMAFDNPLAATELRGRADELRRQLQDAGFTVADDALSFAERDASAGQQGGSAFDRRPDPRNARAFGAASRLEADADRLLTPGRWIPLTLTPDRVDMKV
ncbi:flagellar hook-length control protein FliK [Brevundimonas sp. DC300-4]|uniref:flagellar hook-length control protein FliK n=1 Tax=Brevundimonas sp. DC300-4 TaxID=2804594 RepID=UPI003CF07D4B